jgi:hypothetical protein
MQVPTLEVDHDEARMPWHKYQTHRHYQNPDPVDAEDSIAIPALESITKAGIGEDGLSKFPSRRHDPGRDVALSTHGKHLLASIA